MTYPTSHKSVDNKMRLCYQPTPQRPPTSRLAPISYGFSSVWNEYPSRQEGLYYNSGFRPHANGTPPPPFQYAPPRDHHHTPPPPHVIYVPHETPWMLPKTSPELIYELRDADVLCGRGAPSQYHVGNNYFRDLVDKFQSSYIAARRIDKPEIATHIVDMVRERGGRFLKRTKIQGVGPSGHFCWQDIGEQRAYEKACQALREGAPEVRRKLAAKEVAAAALCLGNIGNTRQVSPRMNCESHISDYSEDRDEVSFRHDVVDERE